MVSSRSRALPASASAAWRMHAIGANATGDGREFDEKLGAESYGYIEKAVGGRSGNASRGIAGSATDPAHGQRRWSRTASMTPRQFDGALHSFEILHRSDPSCCRILGQDLPAPAVWMLKLSTPFPIRLSRNSHIPARPGWPGEIDRTLREAIESVVPKGGVA